MTVLKVLPVSAVLAVSAMTATHLQLNRRRSAASDHARQFQSTLEPGETNGTNQVLKDVTGVF